MPERETGHSPPSVSKVKNVLGYTLTLPYVSMADTGVFLSSVTSTFMWYFIFCCNVGYCKSDTEMSNSEEQQSDFELFACLNQFLLLVGLISATTMDYPPPLACKACSYTEQHRFADITSVPCARFELEIPLFSSYDRAVIVMS